MSSISCCTKQDLSKSDGFCDSVEIREGLCTKHYIQKLESKIKILESALEFYADIKSYSMDDYQGISGEMRNHCVLYGDKEEVNDTVSYAGRRARQALKEAREL